MWMMKAVKLVKDWDLYIVDSLEEQKTITVNYLKEKAGPSPHDLMRTENASEEVECCR